MSKKKQQGLFSKILISLILVFMAFLALWSFRILSHTGKDATNLLAIIYGFFGGELVLLLLKRLFAKEDNKNVKTINDRKENTYESINVDNG